MDGTSARATLGLAPDADQHDIKNRYRLLAKASHPDAGGDAAWFDLVTQAYEVALATPARVAHDHPFLLQTSMAPEPSWSSAPPRRAQRPVVRPFADELRIAMAR